MSRYPFDRLVPPLKTRRTCCCALATAMARRASVIQKSLTTCCSGMPVADATCPQYSANSGRFSRRRIASAALPRRCQSFTKYVPVTACVGCALVVERRRDHLDAHGATLDEFRHARAEGSPRLFHSRRPDAKHLEHCHLGRTQGMRRPRMRTRVKLDAGQRCWSSARHRDVLRHWHLGSETKKPRRRNVAWARTGTANFDSQRGGGWWLHPSATKITLPIQASPERLHDVSSSEATHHHFDRMSCDTDVDLKVSHPDE